MDICMFPAFFSAGFLSVERSNWEFVELFLLDGEPPSPGG
jgi:hypothetical protein